MSVAVAERFWKFVDKAAGDCWNWTGYRNAKGYGVIGSFRDRKNASAHRASWLLLRGDIPAGLSVLHRCDNPPCVNPDHLFLGTAADNRADMLAKGRAVILRGERNGRAKLTRGDVEALRAEYVPGTKRVIARLADDFGISPEQVRNIVSGRHWRTA